MKKLLCFLIVLLSLLLIACRQENAEATVQNAVKEQNPLPLEQKTKKSPLAKTLIFIGAVFMLVNSLVLKEHHGNKKEKQPS